MADKLAFVISPERDNRREVQNRILESVRANGFDGQNYFAINLALEEALTNAIKHGNRHDPKKQVKVLARVTPRRFEIRIEDQGEGFDRKWPPDRTEFENIEKCSERVILLIEAYMTEVSWDRGGRRLKMVKLNEPE